MKVIMIGTGYVGLVTGACFAETGVEVHCVDTNAEKIIQLQHGDIPIYEPGLQEIVARNARAGRLGFSTDLASCIDQADVIFIAVGTPPDEDGSADTQAVFTVAKSIGQLLSCHAVVAVKSTVPVGTTRRVGEIIRQEIARTGGSGSVDMASNPEFLKEGHAVADFMKPDRVVVGSDSDLARKIMEQLYRPFMISSDRMIFTNIASAEMIKYAANAMLATRISFMNEMANLCERLGADINDVRKGIGTDPRIGMKFLYAGCGYGGSCFPKDVKALIASADHCGYPLSLLRAVQLINDKQKMIPFEKLKAHFGNELPQRTIAIWGLAFKPDTDDIREAPSLTLIDQLIRTGCRIQAYDPAAMENIRHRFDGKILLANDMYAAACGADALVLLTEWQQFRQPDWSRIQGSMHSPVIVDGRNIFDRPTLEKNGFILYRIG